MRRRMGRPGLVGTMARTAVIAGTASAVSGNVQRKQQGRAAEAQAAADQQASEQQQAAQSQAQMVAMQAQLDSMAAEQPAVPAAPTPAPAGDLMEQLERLSALRSAGALDDAEFAAAKAKLLA